MTGLTLLRRISARPWMRRFRVRFRTLDGTKYESRGEYL